MKKIIFAAMMLCSAAGFAQTQKNSLELPHVEGYTLLKGDFHIHSVFSDGVVWPTVRVQEAYEHGLDVMSMSEHFENQKNLKKLGIEDKTFTESHELVKNAARARGIILVRAGEITKELPAGHYNALFIDDPQAIAKTMPADNKKDSNAAEAALTVVKEQGGLALWNHPWAQQPGGISVWQPIQQQLLDKGLFSGISVGNGKRYELQLLDWCIDRNLTVFSNTDAHEPLNLAQGEYRNQTIIFAAKRSAEAVEQALRQGLTLGYSRGLLFGREDLARKFFDSSIKTSLVGSGAQRKFFEITNGTGVEYTLRLEDAGGTMVDLAPMGGRIVVLKPFSTVSIPLTAAPSERDNLKGKITNGDKAANAEAATKAHTLRFSVTNIFVRSDRNLGWETTVSL